MYRNHFVVAIGYTTHVRASRVRPSRVEASSAIVTKLFAWVVGGGADLVRETQVADFATENCLSSCCVPTTGSGPCYIAVREEATIQGKDRDKEEGEQEERAEWSHDAPHGVYSCVMPELLVECRNVIGKGALDKVVFL